MVIDFDRLYVGVFLMALGIGYFVCLFQLIKLTKRVKKLEEKAQPVKVQKR